jgi:AsmA protein
MVKRTLNGKGEFVFQDGAIVGIDIAGMVRNIESSFTGEQNTSARPRTDFSELKVPFTLTNGLFNTTGTKLSSPLLRLSISGDAHLAKETLNFKVKPKIVGSLTGQGDTVERSGIMIPVVVGGTFQKPEFRPDMESIIGDLAPKKEDILNALINSSSEKDKKNPTKDIGKSLEEQGKSFLKDFVSVICLSK